MYRSKQKSAPYLLQIITSFLAKVLIRIKIQVEERAVAAPGFGDQENDVAAYTPQVFSKVSAEQFAKLAAKANAAGFAISGNTGRASKMGIEVEWNYSEEKQELVLTCLHAPFFLGADGVNAKLQTMVGEALLA